ncbi:competence protein ComEA [Enterococcus sp. DIV0840]|uniref:ComEA protein n=1 Tax=Enterococcus ureasiticus TaxID=903984 RepID=A0A1E5GMA7_9ENTE|nr:MULTISPECIES: helix-hairpin-helix domain-containing protein [Enterococcus]MBO0433022.1 helix-hairpin-helix domain-containing protein [Enterococcus sp. DIV0849a]OEG13826.1 comEA protein [Enterococcus ureasiticus]
MDCRMLLQKYKHFIIGGMMLLGIVFGVILFILVKSAPDKLTDDELVMSSVSSAQSSETEASSQQIYVDIKGAVEKPGMYEGTASMRVWDAVMLAGGVSDAADTKQVNFSERITDQMVIYVPKIGEEVQISEKSSESLESESKDTSKINLNKASETELQALPGVGQKKAQEIIRYREENGGFKTIEDLKNISGFGEKTFEKLKESITT